MTESSNGSTEPSQQKQLSAEQTKVLEVLAGVIKDPGLSKNHRLCDYQIQQLLALPMSPAEREDVRSELQELHRKTYGKPYVNFEKVTCMRQALQYGMGVLVRRANTELAVASSKATSETAQFVSATPAVSNGTHATPA